MQNTLESLVIPRKTAASTDQPSLLQVTIDIISDACPRDPSMYLCKMQEEFDDSSCSECLRNYVFYVANGCRNDPYRHSRLKET